MLWGSMSLGWLSAAIALAGPAPTSGPAPQGPIQLSAARPLLPSAQPWEDAPELFVPKRPLREADQDRLRAVSLFAAGRVLEREQQYPEALRSYQRALRWDPDSDTIATAVVQLALRMKRPAVAMRYALKAPQFRGADPMFLLQVGDLLAKAGEFGRAAELYERVLAFRESEPEDAADIVLHMESGRLDHLTGKFDKSADHFARVIRALDHPEKMGLDKKTRKLIEGEPAPTYLLFAESFLKAGRTREARAACEKAQQLAPNPGLRAYDLARIDLREGRPEQALQDLQPYFDLHQTSEGVAPYRLLADILRRLGKAEELLPRLEKLRAGDPGNPGLVFALAEQFREKGQLDRAEPLYTMLRRQSSSLGASLVRLAEIYRKTRRPEALLTVLGEIAAKNAAAIASHDATLDLLAKELRGLAITDDRALLDDLTAVVRKRHQADPRRPDFGTRLAVALLASEAKRPDVAGEFFELAVGLKTGQAADVLFYWGATRLAEQQAPEAVKLFRRAIDCKPPAEDLAPFYYYLAGAQAAAGQADAALATARKTAEMKPDLPQFADRLASVLYLLKRYNEAAQAYRGLIEKFDSQQDSEEARQTVREARLMLSTIDSLQERPAEAEEWLEQVLDEFPDDVSAGNDLGYLWAEQGRHLERARQMIQQAVREEPGNAAYRDSLGWVYYQLGQYQAAVAELEKAAADKKPDPVILEHLGDAYLKAGRAEKADATWRRAAAAYRRDKAEEKAKPVERKIAQRKLNQEK
jgi:tetratricopeptide (TPR) repeat protein